VNLVLGWTGWAGLGWVGRIAGVSLFAGVGGREGNPETWWTAGEGRSNLRAFFLMLSSMKTRKLCACFFLPLLLLLLLLICKFANLQIFRGTRLAVAGIPAI